MYASFAFVQKCQTWHDIAWGKWGEVDNKSMFNCCGKPNFPINPDIPRWICVLPSACIWVCRTCVRQYWVLQKKDGLLLDMTNIQMAAGSQNFDYAILVLKMSVRSDVDSNPLTPQHMHADTFCLWLIKSCCATFFLLLIALPKILRSIKRIGRFKQDVKPTSIIQGHDKTMGDQLVGTFIWWKLPFMAAKNGWWAAIFSLLPVYLNVFFMYS